MPLDVQGILQNISLATEQQSIIEPYARAVFINEAPLWSRLPVVEIGNNVYTTTLFDVRPRTYTLNAAILSGGATLTLTDATPLSVGDYLQLNNTANSAVETVEITAVVSGTAVTIRRAREGTTAVANDTTGGAAANVVTLVANSATGSEISRVGRRNVRTTLAMYVQTQQTAVETGGLANATTATTLPAGFSDVFSLTQQVAMTETVRDFEYAMYYGVGEAPAATGDRAKMRGLKNIITQYGSGGNVKTGAGGSYTFLNYVADGLQKSIDAGGNPDAVVCSTSFFTGLQTWGFAKQQINAPMMSAIGLPIEQIAVPFAGKLINFVPSYQLKAGTAIALTSKDVKMRSIRRLFFQKRGVLGDAVQGDFIGDYCIEAGHPGWHTWVEGITSFA